MFDKLLRELQKLQEIKTISVPIDVDEDGYSDRECPNEICLNQFKVNQEDWKNNFTDEHVFCPFCRHDANSDSWWTKEQLEFGKTEVTKHIKGIIDNALIEDSKVFNRNQPKNAFITMSMKVSGAKAYHYMMPIPAKEEMQVKIQCAECNSRYAIIGSAFFCPCCGHNSAEETFDNSIRKIESQLNNLPIIRSAIEQISKDDAENTAKSIVESSLMGCVIAFQRFCEVLFVKRFPDVKLKNNAFQNLEIGGDLWRVNCGQSYKNWISQEEYSELHILFQKRHLLSHKEGIVDQSYLDKSGDSNYKLGQRIVVKEYDILRQIAIIIKLANNIRGNI